MSECDVYVPDGAQIYGNGMGEYHGLVHMIDTLHGFLQLTGALTVPSLEEFQVLPDKVCTLHLASRNSEAMISSSLPSKKYIKPRNPNSEDKASQLPAIPHELLH